MNMEVTLFLPMKEKETVYLMYYSYSCNYNCHAELNSMQLVTLLFNSICVSFFPVIPVSLLSSKLSFFTAC